MKTLERNVNKNRNIYTKTTKHNNMNDYTTKTKDVFPEQNKPKSDYKRTN